MNDSRAAHVSQRRSATAEDTRQQLARVLESALAARKQVLRRYTNQTIVAALAHAAERWLDADYEGRTRAVEELCEPLRIDPAMLQRGLDNIFSVITPASLERLIHEEASPPSGLERPHTLPSGTRARLSGPTIIYHALAGNVPGLSIPAIIVSLLARSIAIVRDSSRQPLLTGLFLETLAENAPALAAMVVPVAWPSSRTDLEALAVGAASRIEIYGSDRTIDDIHRRYPDRAIRGRGTRVSVGLVPAASDTDRWADGFAEDMCMYEGRGCLSPRVIYVVGAAARRDRLMKRLALALRRTAKLWPQRMQDLEDELLRRAFVDRAEVASATNEDDRIETGRDGSWCIHATSKCDMQNGSGMRCVTIVSAADERSVAESLEASRTPTAAVGLAMEPHQDGYHELDALMRSAGATLVCAPGRMQSPPLSWSPDGGRRLGDLLQWRAPNLS